MHATKRCNRGIDRPWIWDKSSYKAVLNGDVEIPKRTFNLSSLLNAFRKHLRKHTEVVTRFRLYVGFGWKRGLSAANNGNDSARREWSVFERRFETKIGAKVKS